MKLMESSSDPMILSIGKYGALPTDNGSHHSANSISTMLGKMKRTLKGDADKLRPDDGKSTPGK